MSMKSHGTIDLQPLFFLLTLDVTTGAILGTSTRSLQAQRNGNGIRFAKAFDEAQHYLAIRGRLGDFYWAFGGSKFSRACDIVHKFVDEIVAESLDRRPDVDHVYGEDKKGYLFIDALAEQTSDVKIIRDQLVNILLAGRDTTACLLSWTL